MAQSCLLTVVLRKSEGKSRRGITFREIGDLAKLGSPLKISFGGRLGDRLHGHLTNSLGRRFDKRFGV